MTVASLASEIARLINRRKKTDSSKVRIGIISGNEVLVDGRYYNCEYAVDADVDDAERVYVILSDDKSKAVVIGK